MQIAYSFHVLYILRVKGNMLFSERRLHTKIYTTTRYEIILYLKVHKREKFFGSDFELFTIL
jgi:hypothetical protein